MPKRPRNRPRDINELAAAIVKEATQEPEPPKNPHAQALGRLGGSKGGLTRAKNLTPEERREGARLAALARWSKRTTSQ